MKKRKLILPGVVMSFSLLLGGDCLGEPPKGWDLMGSHPKEYDTDLDRTVRHSGAASAFLASRSDKASGFAALGQRFKADAWRGKRLRMSAFLQSENVVGWAGLWLRLDAADEKMLTLDNMANRAVKGTTDWKGYEVVVDVPEKAAAVYFGALLGGAGKIWVDDFKFEIVGKDVPTTAGPTAPPPIPPAPVNTGFEE